MFTRIFYKQLLIMRTVFKSYFCFFIIGFYLLPEIPVRAHPQVVEKAEEIFDAARQTVTNVFDVGQGVVNQAIGAAKNGVIGEIDTVQDAARLGFETGRNVIIFGEDYVLRVLNGR